MRTRAILLLAMVCAVVLTGCTLARGITTKHLDFTQNLLPSRNHNAPYTTTADSDGVVGPLPFDIQITGDVRDKFDKYHGGVDYAFLTYTAHNSASAPCRIRLWATLSDDLQNCPFDNSTATLILDTTVPANGDLTFMASQGTNVEELRRIVEALLKAPNNSAACVYVEADCADKSSSSLITISELDVVGRAHGSLF